MRLIQSNRLWGGCWRLNIRKRFHFFPLVIGLFSTSTQPKCQQCVTDTVSECVFVATFWNADCVLLSGRGGGIDRLSCTFYWWGQNCCGRHRVQVTILWKVQHQFTIYNQSGNSFLKDSMYEGRWTVILPFSPLWITGDGLRGDESRALWNWWMVKICICRTLGNGYVKLSRMKRWFTAWNKGKIHQYACSKYTHCFWQFTNFKFKNSVFWILF